ncbi:protein kinase domain-containing protein [Actinomycetospora sp. CA-053990]|uniref:protein kinase domain-containing protein n=1 Tax=Actinomycetospora sp. CA-053990 TaxID=3239891 RepID=UPI003D8A379E
MTGELFGSYRILSRLGRGGMGEVHEAFDTVRERTVALKRLHPEEQGDPGVRERFRRESRIAARLESPHVVPIHDFGVIDGRMFIDMRLVRGRDLGARITAEGALDAERAIAIVGQVADALDAAHDAGLVHRDVKPSNVLLAARDFVYLADFGIVHVREATRPQRLTATGTSLGTPAYMAPEQLRGEPFDHRLDVYALGCVLFEAMTGRPPFVGDRMAVMLSHLNEEPPRPSALVSHLPPSLDDVVLGALRKDPDERPRSAGELAASARQTVREAEKATEATIPRAAAGSPGPVDASRVRPQAGPWMRTPPWSPLARRDPTSMPPPPALPPRVMLLPQHARPGAAAADMAPPGPPNALPPEPIPSAPQRPSGADEAKRRAGLMALVLAVLVPPVGAVAGLVSRRRGGRERRLGTLATVVGAVLTVVLAIVVLTLTRTPAVPASAVEAQIVQQSGLAPGQVQCSGPLPARPGASVTCTASSSGRTQSLRVTVTTVVGDQVDFDITAQ